MIEFEGLCRIRKGKRIYDNAAGTIFTFESDQKAEEMRGIFSRELPDVHTEQKGTRLLVYKILTANPVSEFDDIQDQETERSVARDRHNDLEDLYRILNPGRIPKKALAAVPAPNFFRECLAAGGETVFENSVGTVYEFKTVDSQGICEICARYPHLYTQILGNRLLVYKTGQPTTKSVTVEQHRADNLAIMRALHKRTGPR